MHWPGPPFIVIASHEFAKSPKLPNQYLLTFFGAGRMWYSLAKEKLPQKAPKHIADLTLLSLSLSDLR